MGGGTRRPASGQTNGLGLSTRGRGNLLPDRSVIGPDGLSPRGRGNQRRRRVFIVGYRSIPAWAGEPCYHRYIQQDNRVYPRVGGGTQSINGAILKLNGLSPRGRGNLRTTWSVIQDRRSIPAWAGEPWKRVSVWADVEVYPRVGGGTGRSPGVSTITIGLSPRGRGNQHVRYVEALNKRSIPAWAGEPCCHIRRSNSDAVYPRVNGVFQRALTLPEE